MRIEKGMVVKVQCPTCGQIIVLSKIYNITAIMRCIIYLIVGIFAMMHKNYILMILALTQLQCDIELLTECEQHFSASCNYCDFDKVVLESGINQDKEGNIIVHFQP